MKFKFNRKKSESQGSDGGAPREKRPGSEGLTSLRRAGQDFLAAGEDAISRALSADSAAFIAANRQQGGQ